MIVVRGLPIREVRNALHAVCQTHVDFPIQLTDGQIAVRTMLGQKDDEHLVNIILECNRTEDLDVFKEATAVFGCFCGQADQALALVNLQVENLFATLTTEEVIVVIGE